MQANHVEYATQKVLIEVGKVAALFTPPRSAGMASTKEGLLWTLVFRVFPRHRFRI